MWQMYEIDIVYRERLKRLAARERLVRQARLARREQALAAGALPLHRRLLAAIRRVLPSARSLVGRVPAQESDSHRTRLPVS